MSPTEPGPGATTGGDETGGHHRRVGNATGAEALSPEEPLIDIRTLAAWFAVSESVVRKWTAKGPDSGLVPRFIRINGQIRFRPADVRDFLRQREVR